MPKRSDNATGAGICETVLTEVAATLDEEPAYLTPPLYEVVDPDALEELFEAHHDRPNYPIVVFSYSGCRITVHGPDEVSVEHIEET